MTTIKGLREIEPYVAGSQPSGENLIKLNTNENAYGPSPKVAEVFSQFDVHQLRKYSTLDQKSLRIALAKQHGLDPDQIIVGNGSDDILSMAFLAFFNSDDPVLFPDLTYGFYKVWANLYHVNYHEIPLNEQFEIDSSDYIADNGELSLQILMRQLAFIYRLMSLKRLFVLIKKWWLLLMKPTLILVVKQLCHCLKNMKMFLSHEHFQKMLHLLVCELAMVWEVQN